MQNHCFFPCSWSWFWRYVNLTLYGSVHPRLFTFLQSQWRSSIPTSSSRLRNTSSRRKSYHCYHHHYYDIGYRIHAYAVFTAVWIMMYTQINAGIARTFTCNVKVVFTQLQTYICKLVKRYRFTSSRSHIHRAALFRIFIIF